MRRIVYSVAVSADGFLAREDGSVDWLESRPASDYGFERFLASVDTVVWGRRTWDESLPRGGIEPFGRGLRHIVMTRSPAGRSHPGVEFTAEEAGALARRLRAARGKDVWIMGGGRLAASFLDAGELDAVTMHVIPVLLGSGIPLFAARPRNLALTLAGSEVHADGTVRLDYAIARGR